MAGPVDPEKRQQALSLVYQYLGLRPGDILRFDCSFQNQTDSDHFVVRIDYAASRKGGYQILEGDVTAGSVHTISPVLGRGRVTPRRPLAPTEPAQSREQIEDERSKRNTQFEYESKLDNDRIV